MTYRLTDPLASVDPAMSDLLARERARQVASLHLLAPSMLVSRAVRECVASDLSNLDGEGYVTGAEPIDFDAYEERYRRTGPRKFNPTGPVAEYVELLAGRRLARLFGRGTGIDPAELHVNVHPAAGSLANVAVFRGLLPRSGRVVSLAPTAGGHLSHGTPIHATGMDYDVRQVGFDADTAAVSPETVAEAARAHRADLVIIGASSFPRRIDWRGIAAGLAGLDPRPLLVADVAHFAGLVAAGAYDNPLPWADVVTMVGYKTLGGPKGGVIISRSTAVGRRIDRALFPGLQGAPRMAEIAALGTAAHLAATEDFRAMIGRAVDLAAALERELRALGRQPAFGGTDTHMLVLHRLADAVGIAARLEHTGLLVNANMVPGDPRPSAASGLRLGTVALAQQGLTDTAAPDLARLLSDAIDADPGAGDRVLKFIDDRFGRPR
jgi:glycine hydroxymethyltransferase